MILNCRLLRGICSSVTIYAQLRKSDMAICNDEWPLSCRELAGMFVLLSVVAATTPIRAERIATYSFDNAGTVVPDSEPSTPNFDLLVMSNGTSFASADANGSSPTANNLGFSGQMSEPVEPTNEVNYYGFWANKTILSLHTQWSVLLWFNRDDLDNDDFLFYVGTGDGFSGTGAETYVYGPAGGGLSVHNYATNSFRDMNIHGGTTDASTWHQAVLTRDGSTCRLFLDGELLGTDTSVSLNSFNSSSNSWIVFGAGKWMKLPYMRTRVHDGLIDQIEIYDHALETEEIQDRYQEFIPEPGAASLLSIAIVICLLHRRRKFWSRKR